jgi:hypothetical protein
VGAGKQLDVFGGSCTVTPASCQPRTIIAFSRAAVTASWTRSFTPSTIHAAGAGTASTGSPEAWSTPIMSVRYFSPCALSLPIRGSSERREDAVNTYVPELISRIVSSSAVASFCSAIRSRAPDASRTIRP